MEGIETMGENVRDPWKGFRMCYKLLGEGAIGRGGAEYEEGHPARRGHSKRRGTLHGGGHRTWRGL